MNRRSVIRCILGLAAAPKILAEMDFKPPVVAQSTAGLFNQLNFLVPDYMHKLIEKYGNENWTLTADQLHATFNKAQLSYLEDKLQANESKNIQG